MRVCIIICERSGSLPLSFLLLILRSHLYSRSSKVVWKRGGKGNVPPLFLSPLFLQQQILMVMAHCDDGDERRDGFFRRHKKEEKENDVGVFSLLLLPFASFYPSFGFLGKSEGKEKERGGVLRRRRRVHVPPSFLLSPPAPFCPSRLVAPFKKESILPPERGSLFPASPLFCRQRCCRLFYPSLFCWLDEGRTAACPPPSSSFPSSRQFHTS